MAYSKTLSIALLGFAAVSQVVRADGGDDAPPEDDAMDGGCMSVAAIAEEQGLSSFLNVAGNIMDFPEAAGLVAAVTAEEPLDEEFTIFIPQNGPLLEATVSQNASVQYNIVATHVVGMPIMAEEIADGSVESAEAINGEMLEFTDAPSVAVEGADGTADFETTDIMSCVGPVHIINAVLLPMMGPMTDNAIMPDTMPPMGMPPMDAMPPMEDDAMPPMMEDGTRGVAVPPSADTCENILDALELNEDTAALATTAAAVLPPDVLAFLADPSNNLTVLSPPNDLIECLGGALQAGEVTELEAVEIISLHVIPEYLTAADFLALDGMSVPTAAVTGDELLVMADATGMVTFAVGNTTASVIQADVDGCGAAQVIHLIDGVLLPEGYDLDLTPFCPASVGGAPGPRGLGEEDGSSAYGVAGLFTAVAATAIAFLAL